MKIVCGYIWGLWWWRTSPPNTRVADLLCGVTSLDGCRDGASLLKAAGIDRLREAGILRGIPRSIPLDLVVREQVGHQPSRQLVRHLTSREELPYGSLCQIDAGIYVLTPVYCILQVASVATRLVSPETTPGFALAIVAKVACEMCGTYSISAKGLTERKPLTTVGELATLAISSAGSYGVRLLREAIPYVVPNTRSPKETDIALLFCLPARLGGFALPRPLSNFGLDVSGVRTGFFATWTVCTVDFYWPQVRLVVEYDSWDFHDELGEGKTGRDANRAEALQTLGYTVVTIRRNDLYSKSRFRDKVEEIASALPCELPAPTDEFAHAHETLRMMLLRHDRWV